MGWAKGIDNNGEDIGYAITDICHFDGCAQEIDRGLAYHCGGLDSPRFGGNTGCGDFFCGEHMMVSGVCGSCIDAEDSEE